MATEERSGYDLFLSHSSADKPWVEELQTALVRERLTAFLDKRDLQAGENFVVALDAGVRDSRFLALVISPSALTSKWVEQEWTAHMAQHGPVDRIITILLEPADPPPFLKTVHRIDATHRNVARVAKELVRIVGRAGELPEGDARQLFIGQDLPFVLEQSEDHWHITDPNGRRRDVRKPWAEDNRFGVAFLGFNKLTRSALESDADRTELYGHARTLGTILFGALFPDDTAREQLERACVPGQPRPLVTLRSDDDVMLSFPWELICREDEFLVREARIDMARSTLGPVGAGALLREPEGPFRLVVNVSAPEGSGLNYEGESYRITRALSEHCEFTPTELGTVEDLIETVQRSTPTGIHFSGHGSPGALQFEDDEGRGRTIGIGALMDEFRKKLPDGALPRFFYLASCHGADPALAAEGKPVGWGLPHHVSTPNRDEPPSRPESSAAAVHRAGVPQVVGYYGPIADELSTRAEEALYGAIADGHPTRYAVRQARAALAAPHHNPDAQHRPTARATGSCPPKSFGGGLEDPFPKGSSGASSTHPFGWAQLVFYHRGPDHPLGQPATGDPMRSVGPQLKRTLVGQGDRKRLETGFIGRRSELHRIRRRLREGARVLVFQGLGGLGKTTLAFHALPLLRTAEVCTLWCQETEKVDDPAEHLVRQLLHYCRAKFGADWESVVQQVDRAAQEDPALRFQYFLAELLEKVPSVALYLDNLESLLVGPISAGSQPPDAPPDQPSASDEFATWRSGALRTIWQALATHARDGDKLHVVASCRYRPTPAIG